MGFLANFLDWLYKILVRALVSIKETWVQVTTAVVTLTATVGTMFSNFTWLNTASQYVQTATQAVRSFVNSMDGGIYSALIGWLNVGRLVQCLVAVVTMTVGATCVILVTVFAAVFALVPVVLGVRAVLKAIRTGTGGFIDP